MMKTVVRARWFCSAVCLALALAACGGSGKKKDGGGSIPYGNQDGGNDASIADGKRDSGSTDSPVTCDSVLFDNGNSFACTNPTDTSIFTLSSPSTVTSLRLWVNTNISGQTVSYTLLGPTASVLGSGPTTKGGCDPYQTNWCEFLANMNISLPAGTYTVKSSAAATCSNSGSNNVGMVVVRGCLASTPPLDAGKAEGGGADGGFGADAGRDVSVLTADGGAVLDGGATDGGIVVSNPTSSSGSPGIDLAGYPTRATLDLAGGSVAIPAGPSVTVAPSVLTGPVTIGLRPAATAPVVGAPNYTVLSPWYELATNQFETTVASGVIALDLPASPLDGGVDQPGLQLLAIVNGITLPIDGTLDAATGTFHVELLGLPPSFSFALAYNPNIQKLSSDEALPPLDIPAAEGDALGVPWSTLDWWLVFDGSAIKMDAAKQILGWARAAATMYSNAGLKEPFLRKETIGSTARWYIHLTTDGSHFSEGVAADNGLFGRQYMSVNRVATPSTDRLGSGQASVAHEMFHAILRAYNIPNLIFCNNNGNGCRRSYSGINEGMATAAGYWIDQGSPAKPRPSEDVRPMWLPFGWFSTQDPGTMYANQDFFVYLLRVGSLENFRMHLEGLATAALPANGTLLAVLAAYDKALDVAPTGFGGNFTQTWAWYAADRAYMRDPDGYLWPNEPAGGTPGATYVLDSSLFAAESNIEIAAKDCTPGTSSLDCEVIINNRYPLGAVVVTAKLGGLGLPGELAGKPLTGTFSAFVADGTAPFTVFGENNGKGSETAAARSPSGSNVTLTDLGTDYPTVRMIAAPSGGASLTMMVDMSFAGVPTANVWLLCEGISGGKEAYGCVGWDGDTTFTDAGDECLLSGYMTSVGQFTTRAACTAECTTTAGAASWRTCETPS
jgi:hypothetical protein